MRRQAAGDFSVGISSGQSTADIAWATDHGQSSITFDLKGSYSEFVTYLGLDDDTGPFANVDVEIRVDGQLRFEQQDISPGVLHGPVRLKVNGAQRIKLSVLLGDNADIQDRFNWVEAALIR